MRERREGDREREREKERERARAGERVKPDAKFVV